MSARKLRRTAVEPVDRDLATEFLEWVVDHADLLDVVTDENLGVYVTALGGGAYFEPVRMVRPTRWILVPVPSDLLDALALVGADGEEDLEDGGGAEPDADAENTHPEHRINQSDLALDSRHDDDEEDNGDDEPTRGWEHWVPDWKPWLESDWQQADGDCY